MAKMGTMLRHDASEFIASVHESVLGHMERMNAKLSSTSHTEAHACYLYMGK